MDLVIVYWNYWLLYIDYVYWKTVTVVKVFSKNKTGNQFNVSRYVPNFA